MALRSTVTLLALGAALLGGCASETVFRSNFDQTPVGQPPAAQQAVGAGSVEAGPGQVVIAQVPDLPGRWVSIHRPEGDNGVPAFKGRLINVPREGFYTVSATIQMPAGSGVSTLALEGPAMGGFTGGFLHLDFMPDDRVRIDDDPNAVFGTFPRDRPFLVQITFDSRVQPLNAHVVLAGDGASGIADRAISGPLSLIARQFNALRLFVGFPHTGEFKAANLAVTRRKQ